MTHYLLAERERPAMGYGVALHLVLMRLSSRDLAMACCCSRFWCEVGYSEHLWRRLSLERWPSCGREEARKVIQAMGGFRIFFRRRALSMSHSLSKHLPWLRLHHLTFFLDLTYKGLPLISDILPAIAIAPTLNLRLNIDPFVLTDAILPRHALTPLFYQGQLFYEKPFQPMHASHYCFNWSIVRSTDNKMACLLHSSPVPDGVLPSEEQGGDDEGDDFCLPLLFQGEIRSDRHGLAAGLLKHSPFIAFARLYCRPVWGNSLSDPMRFKLVELELGMCRKDERSSPSLEKMLLAMEELDWR